MKNVKLSLKILGGFSAVALIVLVVGVTGFRGISTYENVSQGIDYLKGIEKELLEREIDHLVWANKVGQFQGQEKAAELGVEKDGRKCKFGLWYYSDARKRAEGSLPGLQQLLHQIEEPHAMLHRSAEHLENLLKKGPEYRKEAVSYYQTETSSRLESVQMVLREIRSKIAVLVAQRQEQTAAEMRVVKWISVSAMIIGVLLAFAIGSYLMVSISRRIRRVVEGLAEGAQELISASAQISSSSQDLAGGASVQAAAIEETSSSLEEMSSMIRLNAEHADQADAFMKESSRVVEDANGSMRELTKSMEEITNASEKTSKIIKTIDEIAFQTNLLALNAAVEAARAGEAGAGFAVVAGEVRNLAMRAAEAAKSTAGMIEGTVKKVKDGSDLVTATNESFVRVADMASKVAGLVAEIAAASKEQSLGIEQLNKAVADMDKVVQENAAHAEENASASEEMNAQADQMIAHVNDLVAIVRGGGGGRERSNAGIGISGRALEKREVPANTAHAGTGKGTKPFEKGEVPPERLIPLKDGDFESF